MRRKLVSRYGAGGASRENEAASLSEGATAL